MLRPSPTFPLAPTLPRSRAPALPRGSKPPTLQRRVTRNPGGRQGVFSRWSVRTSSVGWALPTLPGPIRWEIAGGLSLKPVSKDKYTVPRTRYVARTATISWYIPVFPVPVFPRPSFSPISQRTRPHSGPYLAAPAITRRRNSISSLPASILAPSAGNSAMPSPPTSTHTINAKVG